MSSLGLAYFRQTQAYLDVLYYESLDNTPYEVVVYTLHILCRRNNVMRALIKLETERQRFECFSQNTLSTSSPVKQLLDDHLLPSTFYQETMADFSSTIQIKSIPFRMHIDCRNF